MEIKFRTYGTKLYKEINILDETKDVIVQYLMVFATPEEIKKIVKNLDSLLNIHGEIEMALNVLPRGVLLKIVKRVVVRLAADEAKKVKKTTKKTTKKTSKKKTAKKNLPI